MAQTTQPFRVNEKCSASYSCVIQDENGTAIPGSSLTTLKLTLYDQASDAIINSRDHQSVLGVDPAVLNGGKVDASGNFTLALAPEDNPVVGTPVVNGSERHIAPLEYTYASGAKAGRTEVQIDVANLNKVS